VPAAEVLLLADRQLDGDRLAAEELLDGFQSPAEVRILAVELVDDDRPGQAVLLEHAPDFFRADFDAGHAADDHRRRVHGTEAGLGVPEKIAVAGSVDDIDLVVLPFTEADGGVDGDLPFDLVGVVVRDGISLVDLGQAAGRPRIEQERGRERRLPRRAVPDQGDIPDLIDSVVEPPGILGNAERLFYPNSGFSSSGNCRDPDAEPCPRRLAPAARTIQRASEGLPRILLAYSERKPPGPGLPLIWRNDDVILRIKSHRAACLYQARIRYFRHNSIALGVMKGAADDKK
jgi:hypothetical protein